MASTSGRIGAYFGAQRDYPETMFFSWDVSEATSPIGMRNLVSGHFAFLNRVGPHTANPLEFRNVVLDFTSTISGVYQSLTECITFREVNDRFNLSNLRFWMPSGTALIPSGHIEYIPSGAWIYNAHIPSGYGAPVPSSLPSLPNLRRCDGMGWIEGGQDIHVSEFIYMVITVPSGMGLGRYGLGGMGTLAFKVTYDWYQVY